MEQELVLRVFREDDLQFLDRLCTDPEAVGRFEWIGFIDPHARRRRWEKNAYVGPEITALAVASSDGTPAGIVSYRPTQRSGPTGVCFEIGIALLPEHRGHGLGTAAQRLLVAHLFDHTSANRLEALTDEENVAEQRALERVGFRREGVLRGSYFRRGSWRNRVVYAVTRDDARPGGDQRSSCDHPTTRGGPGAG